MTREYELETGDKVRFCSPIAPDKKFVGTVTDSRVRFDRITVLVDGIQYRPLREHCEKL